MSNKEDKQQEVVKKEEKTEENPIQVTVLTELKSHIKILAKSLQQNDNKMVQKITKQVRRFKKILLPHHLEKVWNLFYPNNNANSNNGVDFKSMQNYDSNFSETFEMNKKILQSIAKFPEVDLYLEVLLLVLTFQQRDIAKTEKEREMYLRQGSNLAQRLLTDSEKLNKRSLDNLNSIVYFYYFRGHELNNNLLQIRDKLFDLYRTASLRFDEIGQATLLNLLLRNYLHFNHYDAAQHLVSKSTFPEQKSNNEFCRYLYYTGKIKAVQLDYSESLSRLNQALRKAPDSTALGFRVEVQKLAIVVELLLGDIPERSIFAQEDLQRPLIPYYKLVQCILKGNLLDFTATVAKFAKYFIKDKLYTLILRLHQMVIKTGLRKINLSYSKISFVDIAQKLHLAKGTEVEFIVAKAIRDGILLAEIDHANKCIQIKEKKEFYTTNEPQIAFQKRIDYCINLYNTSTKALQYPNGTNGYANKQQKEEIEDIDPDELFSDFDF